MRILYITAEVPYPLTSGSLRHYHFLKHLSARHDITLLSLTSRDKIAAEDIEELGRFAQSIVVFKETARNRNGNGGTPTFFHKIIRELEHRSAVRSLCEHVSKLMTDSGYDVAVLSGKSTSAVLGVLPHVPVVVDCCDAAHVRLWSEVQYSKRMRRAWTLFRYWQVRRVECLLARSTPYVVFASERDRAALMVEPGSGLVVPNGVDFEYWSRRSRPGDTSVILFTGVMSYPPNHDAAWRLCTEILPAVRRVLPEVKLVIAGRDPRPSLVALASRTPNITVTGEVTDLRPYLERASVFAAPIRAASGLQNKVLEAMAMELAVVTTSVVAEGLVVNGKTPPLIIANTPQQFAEKIVDLLRDPEHRRHLGTEARDFLKQEFVWSRSAEMLERLCSATAKQLEAACAD